jgi:hypothetical protein
VTTSALILVDKNGKEVTRPRGVTTTPEGISSQDVTFTSPRSFNVRVEKIKDTKNQCNPASLWYPNFQEASLL